MAWFDAHAGDYDAWYDTPLGQYVDRVEKRLLGQLAQPRPGQRALDLGCGTGNHTRWLAGKGLRVTGLDESAAMLEVAARKAQQARTDVDWVRGDAEELPFQEGCLDLVVSVAALEFMARPDRVLAGALRLLRPGGRLVVGLLARDSAWGELYLKDAAESPESVFARARLFDEGEVAGLLAGLPGASRTILKGLYHPPSGEFDVQAALRAEARGQAEQAAGAGFLAVRGVKEA